MLVGLAHSAAYAVGAIALAVRLRGDAGSPWHPAQLRPVAIAVVAGGLAWLGMEAWAPESRGATLLAIVVLGGLALAGYGAALRLIGAVPPSAPMTRGAAAP